MAPRGKSRRRPQLQKKRDFRKKGNGPHKKAKSTNGRDIKHRDQYKRLFQEETKNKFTKKRKVQDDSSESEEEPDCYNQFLSVFSEAKLRSKNKLSVESEDDDDLGDQDDSTEEVLQDDHNLAETVDTDEIEESEVDSDEDTKQEGENKTNDARKASDQGKNEQDDVQNENESIDDDSPMETNENFEEYITDDTDPFVAHVHYDLTEEAAELLGHSKPPATQHIMDWPKLGRLTFSIPQLPSVVELPSIASSKVTLEKPKKFAQEGKVPLKVEKVDWDKLNLKIQLRDNVRTANFANLPDDTDVLTPLQLELFTLMNNYQDLYYPERTFKNGEQVRLAYSLHAANHIIKTRNAVLHHNSKINKKDCSEIPDEYRDQGLIRPKVLILVPFREQARRVVEMLIKLIVPENSKGGVMNRKRFDEEFTGGELSFPKQNRRPEDYEETFAGNTDDTFRLGLTVTRKSIKLYADFYSSDIIISSPLGLRMIIGAEGENSRDFDFLASIEILIIDQAEILLMQNWDHLLHVWDHLHLQPRESHGTDFSRVRSWAVNGWAKFYRQTLLFSSTLLPECSALLSKRCHNYAGSLRVVNPIHSGTICQVVVQLPQVFQRIESCSVTQLLESRFDFLIKKVLPEHTDPLMGHTLIYVPSYFDYVRIRNYLRKQDLSFVQICEYSKEGKIARARDMFYHSQVQFLLYSERFHFFRRVRVKGIRHIIFYQPPSIPNFYSEMCNLMQEGYQNPHGGSETNMTVTVLYSRYDAPKLAAIVGTDRAQHMLTSDRSVYMFMTGE